MLKKILVSADNFFYRIILKNLLKTSKLGYGFVVSGAESGENFEHIYNNIPEGKYFIGKYVDKALLNLPAVHATRGRKEDVKNLLLNEIENNEMKAQKTRVLDLASGGARYLRELAQEHRNLNVESICIDKNLKCVKMGKGLARKEKLKNVKFFRGDIFHLSHLKAFSRQISWVPNIVIASGLFIYFNNDMVKKMLDEIHDVLPKSGVVIFTSYEKLNTRKLMRKTMATSSGEEWTLYYRKPSFWRELLFNMGFENILILRDQWHMNNVCVGRKK